MSISSINGGYPSYRRYSEDDKDQDPAPETRSGGDYVRDAPTNETKENAVPGSDGPIPQDPPGNAKPGNGWTTTSDTQTLKGATADELKGLSDKYDTETVDGRKQSRSLDNDANIKSKLDPGRELDYTGYPPDVAHFGLSLGDTQARLSTLPPEVRDFYVSQLAVLQVAYSSITLPEARHLLEQKTQELANAILQEYNRSINDPLDHALSIFNHPLGEGYLSAADTKLLAQVDNLRKAFLSAPNAAARENIFRQAAELKNKLQHAVSDATDAYLKKDRAEWNDANKYVDQVLQDAEKIHDPVKRYKSINDALFSFNTGMGEDPVADKRVLAFTQRIRDDENLRMKLGNWQVEAGKVLNEDGAPTPSSYADAIDHPPPAGPDYVRDLADAYTHVGKQTADSERVAAYNNPFGLKPIHLPNTLLNRVLEGIYRFAQNIAPTLPGMLLDKYLYSNLSPQARLGIDVAAGVVSFLLDQLPGAVTGGLKLGSRFAAEVADGVGDAGKTVAKKGGAAVEGGSRETNAAEAGQPGLRTGGELAPTTRSTVNNPGEPAAATYKPVEGGPSEDPNVLAVRARMNGKPMQIPDEYAATPDTSTLTTDKKTPGVYTGEDGVHYIKHGDTYYKVSEDPANGGWRIVNPSSPDRYSYPVRFDPASKEWSINTDIGTKGGRPLSRPVSSPTRDSAGDAAGTGGQVKSGGTGSATPQPAASGTGWVPDTYEATSNGGLTPDKPSPGIYRDSMGQGYIKQGGKTYAVRYDRDNATWRVVSPEGGAKPSYPVRLKGDGTWELNPDVGLKGGAGGAGGARGGPTRYTPEKGKMAFELFEVGLSSEEVRQRVDPAVGDGVMLLWARKYEAASGRHVRIAAPPDRRIIQLSGPVIYLRLSRGQPLEEVAQEYTHGDVELALMAAKRHAYLEHQPTQPIDHAWVQYQQAHRPAPQAVAAAAAAGPVPQPELDPLPVLDYDDVSRLLDEGESPQQVSQETGVSQATVENIQHGWGYYSPSKRAYVESPYDPANSQPPTKRPRLDDPSSPVAGPSTSTANPSSPVAGASTSATNPASPAGAPAAPATGPVGGTDAVNWGRAEMRMFFSTDENLANAMDPRARNAILDWLAGDANAPEGLQQEMIEEGFPGLTPAIVRDYINRPNTLTEGQTNDVLRWLGRIP
ncbi:hypothetical protein G3N95_18725 [Paraburkholderia sp. Tr-20389]|uniref:hypothetical protein n=1 Tax=Paraburkholderia sp. Tr-20389 TaxID=2703903 RepID=UPI00197F565A|nr:hypothetical protein [Paraburkholderia sp. Tr-20389]MBN3754989.1 hypothetical protein [Paraburkholderia sp. Tr-20389]